MNRVPPAILIACLCAILPMESRAYEAAEVRAVLLNRPMPPPAGARRIVLATQRVIDIRSKGQLGTVDHILWMAGPDGPDDGGRTRWTYRPGIEYVHVLEGWIHRNDGSREMIPPDSARTAASAATGPGGYPGIADFVVSPGPLAAGEVVDLLVEGTCSALHLIHHYSGEHHFGGPDSTMESEFVIRYPKDLAPIVWWSGPVPEQRLAASGSMSEARWLMGNLPPEGHAARTLNSMLTSLAPDTTGPPILMFAFRNEWESVVATRRRLWWETFMSAPDELVAAASTIASAASDPETRLRATLEWIDAKCKPVELPATRLWFEPADLDRVLARGVATARDRAAATAWLLRRLGIRADVASVPTQRPLEEGMVFPQQLDAWVVLVRPPSGRDRWIDCRSGDRALRPLPAGKALVWTAERKEPVLLPFPGLGVP